MTYNGHDANEIPENPSDKSFYIQILAFRRAVIFLNRNRRIIITGIAFAIALGMTIFLLTDTITREAYDLPDRNAKFVYNFAYPEIAEEVDKSKELKAWIAYVSSGQQDSLFGLTGALEQAKEYLPSHVVTQEYINRYPILVRIIAERNSEWVSNDLARSIVDDLVFMHNDYSTATYGIGREGSCGQYKYLETYLLAFPVSENDFEFVSIVTPNPLPNCYYNPDIASVSIELRHTLDFVDIIDELFEFVYSNSLLLGITPLGLLGALIWRGTISRTWLVSGFSYHHFELMVKMRGSKTRLEILRALDMPKTRQMIAEEVNMDWKAVDRHVEVLLKNYLVKEVCSFARVSYYVRSEKGDRLLDLLNNEYSSNNNDKGFGMFSIALLYRKNDKFLYDIQ